MIEKNCFAWDDGRKCCKALVTVICKTKDECPFYKTKAQYERENGMEYGFIPQRRRPVVRVEDGQYYPTAEAAAADNGIKNVTRLTQHIAQRRYMTCGGCHWRWATESEVKKYAGS